MSEQPTTSEHLHLKNDIEAAIADSIMVVLSISVKRELEDYSADKLAQLDLTTLAHLATENECIVNSGYAATFLVDKHADLFSEAFLIKSSTDQKGLFKRGKWQNHGGLVCKDITGTWHYISPANSYPKEQWFMKFLRQKKENPLLTHLRAQTLENLLLQVEETESKSAENLWPTAAEIQQSVEKKNLQPVLEVKPDQEYLLSIVKFHHRGQQPVCETRQLLHEHHRSYFQLAAQKNFPQLQREKQ